MELDGPLDGSDDFPFQTKVPSLNFQVPSLHFQVPSLNFPDCIQDGYRQVSRSFS